LDALGKLNAYLSKLAASGDLLPVWHGKPNLRAIAIKCGTGRYLFSASAEAADLVKKFAEGRLDPNACLSDAKSARYEIAA
jgi:hypothetical protein